ncbi:FCD domain-containing protein [Jiella sp. MQZ9-1]|nr:FCD domain-containing protein [Jiella flava]
MAELEALCAKLCAQHLSGAALQDLMALHHRGASAAAENDIMAYRIHNERFHTAIYAGSQNEFLERTTLAVRRRLAPFRNLQFEGSHRPKASHAEHAVIVDAIIEGDAERAAAAMRKHILIVRKAVDDVAPESVGSTIGGARS